jgi:hypothetical protein
MIQLCNCYFELIKLEGKRYTEQRLLRVFLKNREYCFTLPENLKVVNVAWKKSKILN